MAAVLSTSHAAPAADAKPLDRDLRGHLRTNADVVTRIAKPVSLEHIPALTAQSEQPILFERIVERPGFRLCDILVKHRDLQARALGVPRSDYLRTLAFRLRKPPRGFVHVKSLAGISKQPKIRQANAITDLIIVEGYDGPQP